MPNSRCPLISHLRRYSYRVSKYFLPVLPIGETAVNLRERAFAANRPPVVAAQDTDKSGGANWGLAAGNFRETLRS
jgi:hypothetical protein